MNTREEITARIRANLPFVTNDASIITEDTILSDVGVSSLHLITLLLTLQQEFGLDIDNVVGFGMPATVGELISLIQQERQPDEQRGNISA